MFFFDFQKPTVSEHPSRVNVFTDPNTAQISIAALFSYFPINPRQIDLKNMSLNQVQNLRTAC